MRAAWFFVDTIYNTVEQRLDLDWPIGFPKIGMRMDWPGDVRILSAGVMPEAQHVHLWLGGIAWPNEQVMDGHYHYAAYFAGQWRQVTIGAAQHDHSLELSTNGLRFLPLRALVFVVGTDSDITELELDSKWTLVVEADTTGDEIGDLLPVSWDSTQRAFWENHMLDRLGLILPTQVTDGERLLYLFLGSYLTRDVHSDTNWRYSSVVPSIQMADMATRKPIAEKWLKAKNKAFRALDAMPFWLPAAILVGQVAIHVALVAIGII